MAEFGRQRSKRLAVSWTASAYEYAPARHVDVALALCVFCLNAALFIAYYNPEIQGYGDAVRGWKQFNLIFGSGVNLWGPRNEQYLRFIMVIVTLLEVFALVMLGLVEKRVLVTYLALPMSAYLATKLKVEFLFFPFALISLRLPWHKELLTLLTLALMSMILNENNGIIFIVFRTLTWSFMRYPPRKWMIPVAIAVIILIDVNFHLVATVFPKLAVYSWTRDTVNPEYSILETLVVFSSSVVLSINPQTDFYIGLPATMIVLSLIFGKLMMRRRELARWSSAPAFLAGFFVLLLFTSLTHAFQNARYYFFYVQAFPAVGGRFANNVLLLSSLPVTVAMTIFYKLYLGI